MRFAIAGIALLLAGCTPPSVQPLYTGQDMLFDPALLGIWRSPDGKNDFVATRAGHAAYRILQTDGGGTAAFTARLVQLGESRFLDLYPAEPAVPNGFYGNHLVRAHSLGQLWLKGDRLKIGLLDPKWFRTPEGKSVLLERISRDKSFVILASTADLRHFTAKYANTKAFGVTSEWLRERGSGR